MLRLLNVKHKNIRFFGKPRNDLFIILKSTFKSYFIM